MPNHVGIGTEPVLRPMRWGLVLWGLFLLLGGCATQPQPQRAEPQQPVAAVRSVDSVAPGWWYLRFRLQRGADGTVDSFLDALIADQVLADVIARHGADIDLWRFHRRWPRDPTGHQFSFIFFAPPSVADAVIRETGQDALLDRLDADGHLVEFRVDRADPERRADPAATSDASWPPEIQREWPKFIMGASHMWLGLVRAEAAKHDGLPLYARYRAVEDALSSVWFQEANHAFFHHLSALFGYKPVRVIRRDVMTF